MPPYGKIRWLEEDVKTKEFKDLQINQNKMLRFINGYRLLDRISTKDMLEIQNSNSVNQLNAQIKLCGKL